MPQYSKRVKQKQKLSYSQIARFIILKYPINDRFLYYKIFISFKSLNCTGTILQTLTKIRFNDSISILKVTGDKQAVTS